MSDQRTYERERKRDYRARNADKERANRAAYYKTSPTAGETTRARCKARYKAGLEYVNAIKAKRGCADCGATPDDPSELHFHHADPSTKVASVADLLPRTRTTLDAEIAKCVVLCADCHRARHANDV